MKFVISTLAITICLFAQIGSILANAVEDEEAELRPALRGLKPKRSKGTKGGKTGGGKKGGKKGSKKAGKKGDKKGGGSPSTKVFMGTVTVTNLAPNLGTCQTPVWVGIHDGTFDIYDRDAAASPELEAIAEDGNAGPLSTAFNDAGGTVWDGVVFGPDMPPVICPGQTGTLDFEVEVTRGTPLYFSYATMVIPSNDAFLANGNPRAFLVFNAMSVPSPVSFTDVGSDVLDAGTEVNDEMPANTAFFGQMIDGTGVDEGGVVTLHQGFNAVGSGGILDDADFTNADFTAAGYQMMQVEVTFDS